MIQHTFGLIYLLMGFKISIYIVALSITEDILSQQSIKKLRREENITTEFLERYAMLRSALLTTSWNLCLMKL